MTTTSSEPDRPNQNSAERYCFLHLRGPGNSTAELQQSLPGMLESWHQLGMECWGVWRGLFGLASNELLVMVAAAAEHTEAEFTDVIDARVEVLKAALFEPTLRPHDSTPRDRPGVYVFRFFQILPADVTEFVELSGDAWMTFEDADAYSAEPQGLFRQQTDADTLDMLLVTWYDSLQSWQTSRQPAADARERFARRHQLTRSTSALATMLIPAPDFSG